MPKVRFIAETAFAHEGDLSYQTALVDEILKGQSDVVKFQVLIAPEYMPDHPMAEKCHGLMLTKADWITLFERVRHAGKQVLILPVDIHALEWVVSEKLADILEIHSVNLFRKDFFDYLRLRQPELEVILSVSGYELEFVDHIFNKYSKIDGLRLSLMFGFQSFPTVPEKLGLGRIALLLERYKVDVGYADHTAWNADSGGLLAAAISLGASTVEKHVVLEPGVERIDFNSAVGRQELDELIDGVNIVSESIGHPSSYILDETERNYGSRRLKLVCAETIRVGEEVTPPKANYRWTTKHSLLDAVDSFESFGMIAKANVDKNSVIA